MSEEQVHGPAEGNDRRTRKSNRRLALVLGAIAFGLYLFMVLVRPLTGS